MSEQKNDYKHTLNLPRTDFPMRANLVQREPEFLKKWEEEKACEAMENASGQKGSYVLHDGPPYANGHLHMGHALNKILKDIIIKSRNMQGYRSHYVPGWDCHGLPIELKVEQELKGKKKSLPVTTVRRICREYAAKWLNIQRDEFKRLGLLGEWDNPYMSMAPEYEAATARELARCVEKGQVVRDKKPIYWCCSCQTALAEAEVEYKDVTSPSIYVAFPLPDAGLTKVFADAKPEVAHIVIWTTTPWTIPANLGVCLHPDMTYVLVAANGKQYILAEERLADCAKLFGWANPEILGRCVGSALERLKARHPLYDRESLLTLGEHVTLDTGTGCVHTAPGHGREDYEVGLKYGLEIYSPLDNEGRYLPEVERFAGLQVFEANPVVTAALRDAGALLAEGTIDHSYPHCWRCKKPVIFRATPQWFISMEKNGLRRQALDSIDSKVQWIPAWGHDRIYNMIEQRPDWCISRQRQWGVPIVALRCERCGEAWNDGKWMHDICDKFAAHPTGCDWWYEVDVNDVTPEGLTCPRCGGQHWKKETDILDVWFDSGTSWAAVLEARPELSAPADLYLEGSDQHRGWFHSSLLVSQITRDHAPYRAVLTHGYVVDGDGYKMSKSVGNIIAPQELIKKFGAEIVRLWVASVDYREDIRLSDQIMNRLVDAYRRIRNTCRYILGGIYDLTPESLLPLDKLLPLDRLALDGAARLHTAMQQAYADYEFHKIYQGLHKYCVTDLSAAYLDVIKDRLYCSAADSVERRSAQTALWHILRMLVRVMAPVLSFTAEEIHSMIPAALREDASTVFALQPIDMDNMLLADGVRDDWMLAAQVRQAMTRAIEPVRTQGTVGHSLDTRVTLYLADDVRERLEGLHTDLREYAIVSQLVVAPLADAPKDAFVDAEVDGVAIAVEKAHGEKCQRCWIYSTELGTDAEHPGLCPRCAKVMQGLK